ncbi:MAG: cupin domain-containing protein [Candidatus Dadabacteria bacterium]|nr:MAG: cupin domain-containing protein [Candidatus Dadabacteria bacterium]
MKIVRAADIKYEGASHEDMQDPGVEKKVLFDSSSELVGRLQMVNWARLKANRSFRMHYHEDMDEIFIILSGGAEVISGGMREVVAAGDAVLIQSGEPHTMRSTGEEVEYIVLGISKCQGGRTVLIDEDN